MRNGTIGQLGKYVRGGLVGALVGLVGGAVYAAAWGLTHWTVTGRGLSSATAPWLVAVGVALGLLAGLAWSATGVGQSETPAEAGRRSAPGVPAGINRFGDPVARLGDTAVLRRLRG